MSPCYQVKSVTTGQPLISVICCAHNEEEYVDRSIPRLLKALKGFSYEIIFIADRCTDNTVEKARKYKVKIIEKNWTRWTNGYAECLQTGYLKAKGKYIGIVDVDILIPTSLFRDFAPMLGGRVASVDARVVTYPDTLWNQLIYVWEKTHSLAPLGEGHYGGARMVLKSALDEINGFRDVFSVDSDVDFRFAERGYKSVSTSAVIVHHARHLSLGIIVRTQMRMGQGRCMIGYGFMRTVAHALFRVRPFVIGGWFMEWIRNKGERRGKSKSLSYQ